VFLRNPTHRHPRLLRAGREGPDGRGAADERDEIAAFQLIELHSMPASQAGLQDIELARVSQRLSGRLHNLQAEAKPVAGPQPLRRSTARAHDIAQ
jgi:hypothetical protein